MEQSSHNTDKTLLDNSYYTDSGNFNNRLHWAGCLTSVRCPFSDRSFPLGQTARHDRLLGFCLAA